MSTYASTTSVSSEKSRAEIETTLRRYGADQFAYATSATQAMVAFVARDRQVRFVLPLPDPSSREFTHTPSRGTRRSSTEAARAYEQAVRSSWRALALIIKAKLEATESGVVTFEQEFGPFTVLPDGSTMSDHMTKAIDAAYRTGTLPQLLPGTSN